MTKKKKTPIRQRQAALLPVALMVPAGMALGYWLARTVLSTSDGPGERLLSLGAMLLALAVGVYLQIAIHEAGHLVFGLLTGYRFSSYRIGSLMLLKDGAHLKLRRFSLAGTGGQCLMIPPPLKDGAIPVVWYNLGGAILNLAASALFFLLYAFFPDVPVLSVFLQLTALLGIVFALTNGIPMRLGGVDNDGYNALSLGKNPKAMESLWVQLMVNYKTSQGMRLREMPEDWFIVPEDHEMQNSMAAVRAVLTANRLMDAHEFDRADALMEHLLSVESGMAGLYKNLLLGDRRYLELIGACRDGVLDSLDGKEYRKFTKAMGKYPSVLRTEYAEVLLWKRDADRARDIREKFEKIAGRYPYESEIQGERELMDIAAGRACKA